MPRVVMNDGTCSRVVMRPLTRPTARPKATMTSSTHQVAAVLAVEELGGDDHLGADQRADRQVELAGDDHQVLAGGQDHQRRRLLDEGHAA